MSKIKKRDRSLIFGWITIVITILLIVSINLGISWQRNHYLSLYEKALSVGNELFILEMKQSLPNDCDIQAIIEYLQNNKNRTKGVFPYIREDEAIVYYKNVDLRNEKDEVHKEEFKRIWEKEGYAIRSEQSVCGSKDNIYVGFIVPSEQIIYGSGIKQMELFFILLYGFLGCTLLVVIFNLLHHVRMFQFKVRNVTERYDKSMRQVKRLESIVEEKEQQLIDLMKQKSSTESDEYESGLLKSVLCKLVECGKKCYPVGGVIITCDISSKGCTLKNMEQVRTVVLEQLNPGQRIFRVGEGQFVVLGVEVSKESLYALLDRLNCSVRLLGEELQFKVTIAEFYFKDCEENLLGILDLIGGRKDEV